MRQITIVDPFLLNTLPFLYSFFFIFKTGGEKREPIRLHNDHLQCFDDEYPTRG